MDFLILILTFVLIAVGTRPLEVILHELGHAIPAILVTRQTVSIYIGSHGDPSKSLHFRVGLLEVWFKYNPILWQGGLCVPSAENISANTGIIYTLAGPLTSVVIAAVACYFTFAYELHGAIKLFIIFFLISTVMDLLRNLIPDSTPITLHDGTVTYNDGFLLKWFFYHKRHPRAYEQAVELYNQKNFAQAATAFEAMLTGGIKNESVYRLTIASFLEARNFDEAKDISDEFIAHGHMDSNDFTNAGIMYSRTEQYDKALALYDKGLALNPDNKFALNNKGFTLGLLGRFEEALPLIDKAIEIDKTFAYSYNNRGLARIKTGNVAAGLDDIHHSLELDKNNAYAYRNLGIYHLDKGEFSEALELFEKAKQVDKDTRSIDDLIHKATTVMQAERLAR